MPRPLYATTLLITLATSRPAMAAPDLQSILDRHFQDRQAGVVLYDATTGKTVLRYHPEHCSERVIACSTFKVPLAVMAFDAGLISESTRFAWDGSKQPIAPWNQDQTAATWLSQSVVWVSQLLTPQLGLPRVKGYLSAFDYGNRDMSGGLSSAWLPNGGQGTLKVSADEQVRFWDQLWTGRLKASKQAQETVCRLLFLNTTPSGARFSGKTGSGLVFDAKGQATGKDIGWFVGHLDRKGHRYIVAVTFTDQKPGLTKGPGGFVARQIAIDTLKARGLY
jgi:beta-lactamase class D